MINQDFEKLAKIQEEARKRQAYKSFFVFAVAVVAIFGVVSYYLYYTGNLGLPALRVNVEEVLVIKTQNEQEFPFGIRKNFDAQMGDSLTSFYVTGVALDTPYAREGLYYIDTFVPLGGQNVTITLKLGRPNDPIVASIAHGGIFSHSYQRIMVSELLAYIKPNRQTRFEITTEADVDSVPGFVCDAFCQERQREIDLFGKEVEFLLTNPSQLEDGFVVDLQVGQVVVAYDE